MHFSYGELCFTRQWRDKRRLCPCTVLDNEVKRALHMCLVESSTSTLHVYILDNGGTSPSYSKSKFSTAAHAFRALTANFVGTDLAVVVVDKKSNKKKNAPPVRHSTIYLRTCECRFFLSTHTLYTDSVILSL